MTTPPTTAPSAWTIYAPYVASAVAISAAFLSAWTIRKTARVSHAAKISEFREKWLNELRRDIADYVGATERVFRKWQEVNAITDGEERDQAERTQLFPLANEARVILWRIRLRLNPRENQFKAQDDALLNSLNELWNPGLMNPQNPEVSWHEHAAAAVEQAREILKREWDVTKRFPI